MSYREMRNVTDQLRRMGYPRLISLESFRLPNFRLLADILRWFLKRYYPSLEILDSIETEGERVQFIRSFVQEMLRKTGLELSPKRLYQSDGYAVKELLKVVQFFTKATKEATEVQCECGPQAFKDDLTQLYEFQPSLHKVRATRELSTFLTEKGVAFYDLVTKEDSNRTARDAILSKPFDIKDYENILRKSIGAMKAEEVKLNSSIDSCKGTINSLNMKITKKRLELERNEQRLEAMSKVRPPHMEEFEKIQGEIDKLYPEYVTRFRILCHLQHKMNEMSKSEENTRRAERKHQNGRGCRDERFSNGAGTSRAELDLSDPDIEDEDEDDDDVDEEEDLLDCPLEQTARAPKGVQSQQPGTGRPQGTTKTGLSLDRGGDNELGIPNRETSIPKRTRAANFNMYGAIDDEEEEESESDDLLMDGDDSDTGSETDEFNESARHPGPTPTGSRNNLHELQNYGRNQGNNVPNGGAKGIEGGLSMSTAKRGKEGTTDVIGGGGDSLTKPLCPDPDYNFNGPTGTADVAGSGKPTGRSSTKQRGERGNIRGGGGRERPPSRPGSRMTQLLDNLSHDDL